MMLFMFGASTAVLIETGRFPGFLQQDLVLLPEQGVLREDSLFCAEGMEKDAQEGGEEGYHVGFGSGGKCFPERNIGTSRVRWN